VKSEFPKSKILLNTVRQPLQPHAFYAGLLVFDQDICAASFCSCKLL